MQLSIVTINIKHKVENITTYFSVACEVNTFCVDRSLDFRKEVFFHLQISLYFISIFFADLTPRYYYVVH